MMECGHQMPGGCAQLIGIGLQRCKPANAQSIAFGGIGLGSIAIPTP